MTDAPRSNTNSLFEEPWWLDAVAPGLWREAIVRSGDTIVARLPYVVTTKARLTVIRQPALTPTLGPWLESRPQKQTTRLAREKTLLTDLIGQLPSFHIMEQDLSPTLAYSLPFHWAGYDVRVRYTYRLESVSDTDAIWSGMHDTTRRQIRKAQKSLEVQPGEDISVVADLVQPTLRRAGAAALDPHLLERIDSALSARGQRHILCAVDAEGRTNAAAYFVWDDHCTYYLLGGRDESLPNLGGPSLLLWNGIQNAAGRSQAFDFEGSMLEPIETFFRGFGGVPTPYLRVHRLHGAGRALAAARDARNHLRSR